MSDNASLTANQVLIENAQIIAPDGLWPSGWLLIEGGTIARTGRGAAPDDLSGAARIDGSGLTALPGFIDLHVHGSGGFDTMDATPEAITGMARFFAAHGVTSFLATTVTASAEATTRALSNAAACLSLPTGGAQLLGVHLEGPYVNLKAKGAQDGQHVRLADPAEYRDWLEMGVIRQVTLAPEFAENRAFLRECAAEGVLVSLGHTQAIYEHVLMAVALGARQTTHTFNAMTALHHRAPGVVGAALTLEALTCEVIADLIHIHPAVLKLTALAKGVEGIVLITDAISGAGMGDGDFELGGQPVHVEDGMATLEDGTLAGSVLTMEVALGHMQEATGLPLATLWPMSSANAARQLGLGLRKGRLQAGYDADVVLLEATGTVHTTIVGGATVYQAAAVRAG
jgi:N-acetylglucosamine-6-phosphate deacetylase